MFAKKANYTFLGYVILEYLVVVLLLTVWQNLDLNNLFINTILSEGIIILPVIIAVIFSKHDRPVLERFGIKGMKLKTFFAVILYGIVIMPLGTLANTISLLFVDNEVLKSSGSMLDANLMGAIICSSIIAPFVEELVFRGYIYNGYRKDGAGFSAVILSALMFAFMHMNFNQAAYALVLGIAFALVYEATGSVWSSIICHLLFNSESVIVMFAGEMLSPGMYDDISVNREEIASMIPPYVIASIVAVVLAWMIIKWIVRNEERSEIFNGLFSGKLDADKKVRIISWPVVVALLFCLVFMIVML